MIKVDLKARYQERQNKNAIITIEKFLNNFVEATEKIASDMEDKEKIYDAINRILQMTWFLTFLNDDKNYIKNCQAIENAQKKLKCKIYKNKISNY